MKLQISITLATMSLALPAIAAERWESESRLAHVLVENNQVDQALERYNEAIRLLESKSGKSSATILDLQLNKVQALIDNQRLQQAKDLLTELEPQVVALKNPSLEIRYRRRLAKLLHAQKNYTDCCRIRALNLKAIAVECGPNTLTYSAELRKLMETALDGNLWPQYLEAAKDLRNLNRSCVREKDKQQTGNWLELFFQRSTTLAIAEVKRGNLTGIKEYLVEFSPYSKDDQFAIDVLLAMFQKASEQGQNDLADSFAKELNSLAAKRKILIASRIAALYLYSVRDDIYKENVSLSTESRLKAAVTILEHNSDPSTLSNSLLYLHCKSMYALALTSRHKAAEAERALDQLSPGPEMLRDTERVTGIVQARIALGREFHRIGNDKSAHRQFAVLYQLMERVKETPERQTQLTDLREQEALIFRS